MRTTLEAVEITISGITAQRAKEYAARAAAGGWNVHWEDTRSEDSLYTITVKGSRQTDLRYLVLALDDLFGPEFVDQIRERNRRAGQRELSSSRAPQLNGLPPPARF